MLEVGSPFPKFSLPNQDGKTVTLNDFAGKWLVVYVYPKDDTPGCTIQGKSFTATRNDFQASGIEVVGVSQDDVASHKSFCNLFASRATHVCVLAQGAPVFWFGRTRRRPHTTGFSAGSVTSDSWELASAQRFLCPR